MAHIALCTSLYNPDWLKALCWTTEERQTNAGERSPSRAGYTRQTDLQCQTRWHVTQKQGQCQPATGIRTRSWLLTSWSQGCNGKGGKGPCCCWHSSSPRNDWWWPTECSFELGFCIFYNEFQCLAKLRSVSSP